jgi:hypothetical protein
MAADVVLRCPYEERELALEAAAALAAAGLVVAAPDLQPMDAPERERSSVAALGSARLCLIVVTREGTRRGEVGRALAAARAAGIRTILAWWDEDAPSDFLAETTGEERETIVYSCLLPRPERLPRLVEPIVAELSGA